MNISVLICTWNNSKRLAVTLETFTQCMISPNTSWELVLVNNNCTDDTDQIVERYFNRLPIVYVHEPVQGLSQARNTALSSAKGELILFADDDVKPEQNWILVYWKAFQQYPQGYFFGGPVISDFERDDFDKDLLQYATQSVSGLNFGDSEKVINKWYFIGANWACAKTALDKVGGFDTNKGLNPTSGKVITGEETDLIDRLRGIGLQALYLPKASLRHFVPAWKCTLAHISNRQEAYYKELSLERIKNYQGLVLFGIPCWMFKAIVLNYLKWILRKITFKKGYKEYIEYRETLGSIKGAFAFKKSQK